MTLLMKVYGVTGVQSGTNFDVVVMLDFGARGSYVWLVFMLCYFVCD